MTQNTVYRTVPTTHGLLREGLKQIKSVIMIKPPRTTPLFLENCDHVRLILFALFSDYLGSQVHYETNFVNFEGKVLAKQCK